MQEEEKKALEAATDSVRQDLEVSEAHAEALTQELVNARVLASKAEALAEQCREMTERNTEMEGKSSSASIKLEEAERLLTEERGRVEALAQELADLRVSASEAEGLSGRYRELSDANSKLESESQGCNSIETISARVPPRIVT